MKDIALDEAIVHAQQIAENGDCDAHTCAYQHDRLVDWLEELKQYRATGLRPEEIAELVGEMVTAYDENQVPYAVDATGKEAKHILGLLEAERNGCLLVTPCKPGGGVFFVLEDIVLPEKYYLTEPHKVVDVGYTGFWVCGYLYREIADDKIFVPWERVGVTAFFDEREANEVLRRKIEGMKEEV